MRSIRILLILGALCIALGGCGSPGIPDHGWTAVEDQLQRAIVSSTDYPPGSIEVLASPTRVHVSVSDRELARADHAARERAANALVAIVEQSIATNAQLATVEEIQVVIVHPEEAHGLLGSTHTEDVMDFKRGPDKQFCRDVL